MDQRDRESRVRIPGVGSDGGGLHLGAQQPRERAHALVATIRSPTGPGEAIYLRDEETGELWTAAPAPIRHEDAHYYLCARHGLQPLRAASRTASRSSSRCWCRSRIPSRSAGCAYATIRRAGAASRSPRTSSGCWARRAPAARRTSSPSWMPDRCAVRAQSLEPAPFPAWHSPICAARRPSSPATAASSWVAMECSTRRRRWSPARHSRAAPARHSIRARRCARASNSNLASSTEFVFLLGEAADGDAARALLTRYRSADVDALLDAVRAHWERAHGSRAGEDAGPCLRHHDEWLAALSDAGLPHLGARRVSTRRAAPMASAISCRTRWRWGWRSPQLLREQILRAAARQFPEGDVQHWWLPHSGQGVRTHISDDRVWLSFVTAHYVALTGDRAILDVELPFIEGPPLPRERHDAFFEPAVSDADRDPVRTLPARSRGRATGRTRPAADRHRRLERRHESRRRTRPRRERLARLVPARHAQRVRAHRASARRTRARHRLARPGHAAARRARTTRLGWRMVSPRILRRRHAARLGQQR